MFVKVRNLIILAVVVLAGCVSTETRVRTDNRIQAATLSDIRAAFAANRIQENQAVALFYKAGSAKIRINAAADDGAVNASASQQDLKAAETLLDSVHAQLKALGPSQRFAE
jgi:hypothetical protein